MDADLGRQLLIKFRNDLQCWAIDQVEGTITEGIYMFAMEQVPYVGMTTNLGNRERAHRASKNRARKLTGQFERIFKVEGTSLRNAEQFILDLVRLGAEGNPDDILKSKVRGDSRVANSINPLNERLRNELRKTYKWCK